MTARNCPFCGVVADVPHENQQVCIDALHAEIARMRDILDSATGLPYPDGPDQEPDPAPRAERPNR